VNIYAYYADQVPIMQTTRPAKLVLEDGTVFAGSAVGAHGVAAGEACFTTAMAGYEEAASDPSYLAQVLAFSYPLIGNYGVDSGRLESDGVYAEAIVMRRARPAWKQWLASQGVVALEDVDTRTLVRKIRDGGVLRCALGEAPVEELHARALAEPPIDGRPLSRAVGTAQPYRLGTGPRITVLDLGTKRSIPARLAACGLEVMVVPGDWDADSILETGPRAVLVSNGPGDPAGPGFRHLPGSPDPRARPRAGDVQASFRAPRGEPSRSRPQDRARARDRSESRLRGRRRRRRR
jgi:carbamoyl-phosphate synthase small subunit